MVDCLSERMFISFVWVNSETRGLLTRASAVGVAIASQAFEKLLPPLPGLIAPNLAFFRPKDRPQVEEQLVSNVSYLRLLTFSRIQLP